MLHIIFDHDRPSGFRDIQVQMCELCVAQGQVTPKWVVLFGPKSNSTELLCLSWLVVTSNFDDDSIKNELASMETPFSHYKSMGILRRSRAAYSVVSGPIWPKIQPVQALYMSSLPASIKSIGSKATEKRWRYHFPYYKSMGAFCCHVHQTFDPICLKTLCSLSSPPVMLHIKFDQDWLTGLRDIQVRKCKIFVIQGQVTPKWVVWSGLKSNSSELLCLSWLPAIMMNRLKMNELAWRQHFPIISLWQIF